MINLLTSKSAKFDLSQDRPIIGTDGKEYRYAVTGCALSPADYGGFGNVCPHKGACADVCVMHFAGRRVSQAVRNAAQRRTKLFFENRERFYHLLALQIEDFATAAESAGLRVAIRLNEASDLNHETLAPWLFGEFPKIDFYDYTKSARRMLADLPENYSLTYSWSERSAAGTAEKILAAGRNVAVVFDTPYVGSAGRKDPLPADFILGWKAHPVIDGDLHDLRLPHIDGRGVLVGLRGKGGIRAVLEGVESGFIVPVAGGRLAESMN